MDARIVIETDAYVAVAFAPPVAEFHTRRSVESALHDIGPDLLDTEFDASEAIRRLRVRNATEIASALLDQRALAGIGNVFKSEILFACRVDPFAQISAIDDETLRKIVEVSQRLLRANVADPVKDPTVSNRGIRRTTRRMDPRAGLWVYGRGGEPCRRCGTPIESKKHGPDARRTYWCPRCQTSSTGDL
jgi:endonuclease-8